MIGKRKMRSSTIRLYTIGMLVFMLPVSGSASPEVLWRIGRFDHSSREFRAMHGSRTRREHTLPLTDVIYTIGRSSWNDWPAFLPAGKSRPAGRNSPSPTIRFRLNARPAGTYEFKAAFTNIDLLGGGMGARRRLSVLRLNVNGHVGEAFQHPRWHAEKSGGKILDDVISIEIPTGYLKRGVNTLTLSAFDNPPAHNASSNSGFDFDALELLNYPRNKFDPRDVSVRVEPTVFYKRAGGGLSEIVDAFASLSRPAKSVRISISIDGHDYHRTMIDTCGFGEQKASFEVAEFSPGTAALVSVVAAGNMKQFEMILSPARKWKVFMIPSVHLDVGFTDYRPKVALLQGQVIAEAMRLVKSHPDFSYSPDGFWAVQHFFAERSSAEKNRFLKLAAEGKLFVPAQYANLLTGFASTETLIRSLYPAYRFDRKHNLPFDYANTTDVPSYSWSYASVLADAGIEYFEAASNNGHAPILRLGGLDAKTPFWWEGPDGKKVFMWYTKRYAQMARLFGVKPGIKIGEDALPRFLGFFDKPSYKSNGVIVFGDQHENSYMNPGFASLAGRWDSLFAYPHLQYSGVAEAMSYIKRQFGGDIPVIRGDGGPYWEDGIASDAKYAAIDRETMQRALSAEKLSTLTSLIDPRIELSRSLINNMWQNIILYDEHTWGSSEDVSDPGSMQSVGQLAAKHLFALQARNDCMNIIRTSADAIAEQTGAGAETLVAFNTLNWARSGMIDADIPLRCRIYDAHDSSDVPFQVLNKWKTVQKVRFESGPIPPLGYKCFVLKKTKAIPISSAAEPLTDTLENRYYRIVLDSSSGAVKSIFDRQLGKELVNQSGPYLFDQYVYVSSGNESPLQFPGPDGHGKTAVKLAISRAENGRLVSVTREPYGTVALLRSSCKNTPEIETKIILFNGEKKIEFVDRIYKKRVYAKEAAYFAFPFSTDDPEFRYETQNGYVDPSRDLLPGAGREWFSVQHWVAASEGGTTAEIVPVNASLVTFGNIVRGKWPATFGKRAGTVFSYIMNNYWKTNYVAAQGGEFTFRYLMTSGRALTPGKMSRFGWNEMTPIEVDRVTPNDAQYWRRSSVFSPEKSYVTVSSRNVVLSDWKRAENNRGTIMRFIEMNGTTDTVSVSTPLVRIDSVWKCDAVERDERRLPSTTTGFKFVIKPFRIETIRIEGN